VKLIYFSPVSWNSFTQRPHEFVWFCQEKLGCDVIWIEPYPTRIPKFSDIRRIEAVEKTAPRDVPTWLTIISPRLFPVEPLGIIRSINLLSIKRVISALACCNREDIFVVGKPSLLAKKVLDHFRPSRSLYDAMDDFPQFYSGLSSRYMAQLELEVAAMVSQISVSSHHLCHKFTAHGYAPILVLNGCSSREQMQISSRELNANSHLKVGYVGTIGEWFDWGFLVLLAQSNPKVTFDIIGPVFQIPPAKLPLNIILKPAVDHATALELMGHFDIGLIPFKCNKLTDGVDPIKYYEYKRFGLSIISTKFGEMAYRSQEVGVYLLDASLLSQINLYRLQSTDPNSVALWSERFLPLLEKIVN